MVPSNTGLLDLAASQTSHFTAADNQGAHIQLHTDMIHPTAVISADAEIHPSAEIGPHVVITGKVVIEEGVVIHPNVVIYDGTTLGKNTEVFPGAFIGKEPKGAGATARQPVFAKTITIGQNCSIGPHAVIFYDVSIGNNTLLGDGASVREKCRIGSFCILSRYVTINYNTTIGDRTKIMDCTHITGNAEVGEDVFISLLVGTTNDNSMRAGYSDEHTLGPRIENQAVIGVGASLLPGITIGERATIGAGSVVTKNVDAGQTVVGAPARPR